MADKTDLPHLYTTAMKRLGRGHGFYRPPSCTSVRPGLCGYIDRLGIFRPIADLNNKPALLDEGYTAPSYLLPAEEKKEDKLSLASSGVTMTRGGAGAGAGIDGVEGKVQFSLGAGKKSGAVLLTTSPVFENGFEHESDLTRWARKNRATILRKRPEVKEYGFCIVQTTWVTEDVHINAWTEATKEVSIDLGAYVAGQAHGNIAGEHMSGHAVDGGWVHPLPSGATPGKYVIFFNGPKFKYFPKLEALNMIYQARGADSGSEDEGNMSVIVNPGDKEELCLVPWHSDIEDEDEEEDDSEE